MTHSLLPRIVFLAFLCCGCSYRIITHDTFCLQEYENKNESTTLYYLRYPDSTLHNVSIPIGNWTSSQVVGEIAYILVHEVIRYSSHLFDTEEIADSATVNYVVGCFDPNDASCPESDINDPKAHFTIESWQGGINRVLALPANLQPVLLNVLDYYLDEQYFVWQSTLDKGLQSKPSIWMNFFGSYNASQYRPHEYFDSWQSVMQQIPPSILLRCSEDFLNPDFPDIYFNVSGDENKNCAWNDSVWFSLACRSNNSECVPLVIPAGLDATAGGRSAAMQFSYFFNMPLAIVMVDGPSGNYKLFFDVCAPSSWQNLFLLSI